MTSATLQRAPAAIATTDTAHPEFALPALRTLLRARTRYYERHVLAWYALGRVREARATWAAVCELRRRLAAAESVGVRDARASR